MNVIRINKKNKTPLYSQIYQSILDAIELGILRDQDPLPYEEDVSDFYHVSRQVVRQAYDELQKEGIIKRIRRKGTFIHLKPFIIAQRNELLDLEALIVSRSYTFQRSILLVESLFVNHELFPHCFKDHYKQVLRIVCTHNANQNTCFIKELYCPDTQKIDLKHINYDEFNRDDWFQLYNIQPTRLIYGMSPHVSTNIEALTLDLNAHQMMTEHSIQYMDAQNKSVAYERLLVDGSYFYIESGS